MASRLALYNIGRDEGGPWYNDVSRHFEDPWQAAQAAAQWKQKAIHDYDALPGDNRDPDVPDYMARQRPEPSTPGHYFGRRR